MIKESYNHGVTRCVEGTLKHEGKVEFEDIVFTELKEKLCRKKELFS